VVQSGIPLAAGTKIKLADDVRSAGRLVIDWRVAKLLQYIDRQNGVTWNLEHICRELRLGISPPYAARLFERHTGQGLRNYAKRKRLLKAVEQLIATDLPIKVIAAELGYRKPFDLARTFEAQYSLTPTRFRNANRLRLMSQAS